MQILQEMNKYGHEQIVFANDEITIYLNSERLEFDVPPQIIDDRTMVPLRVIFEALGAEVEWNEKHQMIWGRNDESVIGLQIDRLEMTIAKYNIDVDTPYSIETITLDVAPILLNGRTLVPIRAVSEAFGATVNWIEDTKTVEITTKNFNN